MRERVFLHLYQLDLDEASIRLDETYYDEWKWMTPEEYEKEQGLLGLSCGLCLRLWSDYSVRNGLAEKSFAPALVKTNYWE